MLTDSAVNVPSIPVTAATNTAAVGNGHWRLMYREGTGLFIVSQAGTLLFRIEPKKGMLFLWDRKVGKEISVKLNDLMVLQPGV